MRLALILLLVSVTSAASAEELFPDRPSLADCWSEHEPNWFERSVVVRGQSEEGAEGGGGGDLASKSQNPVSDLVSLPLQNNFNYGLGPGSRPQYIGNLQPVVPVKLNEDWNLINRVIVPFVNTPVDGDLREHGIGDAVGQFFFSPRNAEELIWGVGPSVMFPTASDPTLGFQKWGAGVTAVALVSKKPIVAGVLVNQIWGESATTQPLLIQPFFNYNLPEGWFLLAGGEANADWQQPQDQRWSFVFGPGFGRVFPLFGQPINASLRFAPYLEKPTNGPDWQLRLQINLLFPK
jgi:hypothetical protein